MEAIDLTLDDDEVDVHVDKRARTADSSDSDVELVDESTEPDPRSPSQASEEQQLGDDEDLVITKQTGQV